MIRRLRRLLGRMRGYYPIPAGVTLGEDVFIGQGVSLDSLYGFHIVIGNKATLVDGARVLCHDASSYRRLGISRVAGVNIGDRAFIGADSIIMPGVTVGADSIVGAGSVVTHDVPPGSVAAGVPARVIGRTADLDAERLEEFGRFQHFVSPQDTPVSQSGATERMRALAQNGGYYSVRKT